MLLSSSVSLLAFSSISIGNIFESQSSVFNSILPRLIEVEIMPQNAENIGLILIINKNIDFEQIIVVPYEF